MTEKKILRYLEKPYESYVDTNVLNLKNLFRAIKKENIISNEEFARTIRPVITGEIERYYLETYDDEAPFWGAWYKDEEREGIYWADTRSSLTDSQRATLSALVGKKSAPGEMIGYGLCVFAGLSVTEALNARYRDLSELRGSPETATLYTRGAFPKTTMATEYDGLPREIPLLDFLKEILEARLAAIEETEKFPIENEYGTFSCAKDLPIACEGHSYSRFCSIAGLSRYARDILRCDLGFDEPSMSRLQNIMLNEPGLYAFERSSAYYLGRRDFATMMSSGSIYHGNEKTMHYLMGHWAPGEECGKIIDVTAEELKEAKTGYEILAARYVQRSPNGCRR